MRRLSNLKKHLRHAFTLVEILIVVVILGILAAIVVPHFPKATDDARGGNLKAQLSTLQNQIELYAARNGGVFPTFPTAGASTNNHGWDSSGTVGLIVEDYLKEVPKNPAGGLGDNGKRVIQAATGTGAASVGWLYNTADQTIYASFYDEAADAVTTTATD
jgi:general secretion pathway protein G